MSQGDVLVVFREAILLILRLAAPLLIVSIGIGLIVSIFQAATQINEQTLTFVPKIVAIAIILIFAGAWMLNNLVDFFNMIINIMLEL